MKLNDLISKLNLIIVNEGDLQVEIKNGHIGDLLSEVMRNAKENCIWITHQTHQNILAVADVVGINAILIPKNIDFLPETIKVARERKINLLKSDLSGFEITGKIYQLLKNNGSI